jgi:hypothetical protein
MESRRIARAIAIQVTPVEITRTRKALPLETLEAGDRAAQG